MGTRGISLGIHAWACKPSQIANMRHILIVVEQMIIIVLIIREPALVNSSRWRSSQERRAARRCAMNRRELALLALHLSRRGRLPLLECTRTIQISHTRRRRP